MELESCVPPGFRFHPTEEELVGYYLKRKVASLKIDLDVITEIDLYNMEPCDIEDRCKLGYEEQNEWYFFSHKDRKYPTGKRTNRATGAGFWKATGRDKAVLSKERIIGMRKTLVYYRGRAPNGRKSDWIMHEYRLQTSEHGPTQEEGWVVCRAFKKPNPSHRQGLGGPWNVNPYYVTNSRNCRTPSYASTSTIMQKYDHLNQGTSFHDSPRSISTNFASNDNNFDHLANLANGDIEDEKSSFGNQLISESFDKLLESQVLEPPLYAYTNMPLDLHGDEFFAQNHFNNVLECFPDL